ncbi:MAG: hypothetical protein HRT57_01890 [Crocinitomicaceae bacterium]|nr:hypothetical protein [Crocinitomicaceae bacterium]
MLRLLVFTFIIVLSSCTVTKRVHRPGWMVEWHSIKRAPKPNNEINDSEETDSKIEVQDETLTTSSEIESKEQAIKQEPTLIANQETISNSLDETDTLAISEDQKQSNQQNLSLSSGFDFFKELSFNKKTPSNSTQKANRKHRDGGSLINLGLIIMFIGIFFLISVIIAWADFPFIQFNSFLGIILYILLALTGFLLINAFGLIPAIITSLCIAGAGGLIALVGTYMNR